MQFNFQIGAFAVLMVHKARRKNRLGRVISTPLDAAGQGNRPLYPEISSGSV